MKSPSILMYLGGFAKVGGIETFARDLLLAIANTYPRRELVIWGRGPAENPLLREIAESGVAITRNPMRWGCRWNLPDLNLLRQGAEAVRRSSVVIFKRPPPRGVLRQLRKAARLSGRHIPFMLVTPYRPAEYWKDPALAADLDCFDVITVQSEDGKADLEKLGYRGRVENIPLLPPRLQRSLPFPSSVSSGTVRLGFLGRLESQKNLPYLLEIYHLLTREEPQTLRYELHLFGEGKEDARLRQSCSALHLPDVTFHGAIPQSDVPAAVDSCDLFLNTSFTEGQCLVALEVLSRGRPFIATPVGALPDVLESSALGRLAPLGDAAAFAKIVSETAHALIGGQISPHSVQAAFQSRYDYQTILNRYLDLLASLLTPDLPTLPERLPLPTIR